MDDFTEVYQMYYHKVNRFLLSLSGDPHKAEELTQEVFYKALLHIDQYQDHGNMSTWLCTIGKNSWLNECRKLRRFISIEDDFPSIQDTTNPKPEDSIMKTEQHRLLRKAILELPEDYRDIVILHIYGEIPLREIAATKGKSESWGKVTYYRAKQLLASKLKELK